MKKHSKTRELVYQCWDGQFIVVAKAEALYLAERLDTFMTSKTWGELDARLDRDDFEQLCNEMRANERDGFCDPDDQSNTRPSPDAAFDGEFVYEESFWHWIPHPCVSMLQRMPDDIRQQFGRIESGMLSEPELAISANDEARVVARLESIGHRVKRDDELVHATWEWEAGRWQRLKKKYRPRADANRGKR